MKSNILFTACLMGVLVFSSCEKDLYDPSKQPQDEKKVTDLRVPADFNWKMVETTKYAITANVPTMVSIFLDESCQEGNKLATIPVDTESAVLPLSVPTDVKTVYAQYESNVGKTVKSIEVNTDGTLSLQITDAKATPTTRANGGDNNNVDWANKEGVIHYPKDGWGTIMFEDFFPNLGDYDFNDLVINYKVQLQDVIQEKNKDKKGNKEYKAKVIQIGLRLKAMGATFTSFPYLRLKEIDKDKVESIEVYESENVTNPSIVITNEGDEDETILDCSALTKNLSKPAGSQFYNTEKDYLVNEKDLPEIHFVIYLTEHVEIEDILEDDEFDFYLKYADGKEIHLNGFKPVSYQYPIGESELRPIEDDDDYYYNKDNFVWGLKVPEEIPHAIETGNFLKAYGNFAKWLEDGKEKPQDNHNWYKGNKNKEFLIY